MGKKSYRQDKIYYEHPINTEKKQKHKQETCFDEAKKKKNTFLVDAKKIESLQRPNIGTHHTDKTAKKDWKNKKEKIIK